MTRLAPLQTRSAGARLLGAAASLAILLSCASEGASTRTPRTWTVSHDGPRDHATVQAAIDAAAPGDIVRIGEGLWAERLVVDKPLTLVGAGALQTVIVASDPLELFTEADQARIQRELASAISDDARALIQDRALASTVAVLVTANDVTLDSLGVRLDGRGDANTIRSGAAVLLKGNDGRIRDCAIVGSPSSGVLVEGGDVVVEGSLVAAVEATGIAVARGSGRVEIRGCDVRDAIHRGITIGRDEVLVERCRISGSAWHGIRYDNVGPTIRNNLIFENKRSGIYASGRTSAHVTDNLFLENGFNGLSTWYENRDTVERNTFAYNGRAAVEILGGSQPALRGNVFAWSPTGVLLGDIGSSSTGGQSNTHSDGGLELAGNVFFRCGRNAVWTSSGEGPSDLTAADRGYLVLDPGFASAQSRDFSLPDGSAGKSGLFGAMDLPGLLSPWPRQPPEELSRVEADLLSAEAPAAPLTPAQNPYLISTPWVEAAEQAVDAAERTQAQEHVIAAVRSDDSARIHAGLLAISRMSQLDMDWTPLRPRIQQLCATLDGEAMRRAFYALRVTGSGDGDLPLLLTRMHGGQTAPEMSHLLMVFGGDDVSGEAAEMVLQLLATNDSDDLREVMRGLWGARVDAAVEARLLEISRTRSEQDCIYFALSTLQDKSPAVIERLFEAARSSDSNVFTRALWGLGHGIPEANTAAVADGATALLEKHFVPEQRQLMIQRDARHLLEVYGTP